MTSLYLGSLVTGTTASFMAALPWPKSRAPAEATGLKLIMPRNRPSGQYRGDGPRRDGTWGQAERSLP